MGEHKQIFVVRVWQHLSQFRASVRPPGDGEPRLFTEPAQVGEYLGAAAAASETAAEGERYGDDA